MQLLNTHLLHGIPIRLLPLLPLQIVSPTYDLQLLRHTKGDMLAFTCLWLFAEHLCDYSDYTVIYTDRSLLHSLTGCALIYEGQVFSYHLHSFNSMYATELSCVFIASLDNVTFSVLTP